MRLVQHVSICVIYTRNCFFFFFFFFRKRNAPRHVKKRETFFMKVYNAIRSCPQFNRGGITPISEAAVIFFNFRLIIDVSFRDGGYITLPSFNLCFETLNHLIPLLSRTTIFVEEALLINVPVKHSAHLHGTRVRVSTISIDKRKNERTKITRILLKKKKGGKKRKAADKRKRGEEEGIKIKRRGVKTTSRILANATCVPSCLNKEPLNVIKQQDRKLL